jgi:hypothetical protein
MGIVRRLFISANATLKRSDNINTEANQKSLNRSGEHH